MTQFRVVRITTDATGGNSDQSIPDTSNSVWTSIVLVALRRTGFLVGRPIRFWRDYYLAMRELDGLSDHDLRDLRVSRGEICRLAWKEALRRQQLRSRESLPRE
jgi:uncharacterized protein YjiS (DUF1127 family)